jgi:hypothetical protein
MKRSIEAKREKAAWVPCFEGERTRFLKPRPSGVGAGIGWVRRLCEEPIARWQNANEMRGFGCGISPRHRKPAALSCCFSSSAVPIAEPRLRMLRANTGCYVAYATTEEIEIRMSLPID